MVLKKLDRKFYARDAKTVAIDLLGKVLVHQTKSSVYRARIVETEAYVGTHDLACHASRGRTQRTEIMFGPPGYAYVYLIYGMYSMLNFVTSHQDDAQAVLIRAAESLDSEDLNLSGPGRLTKSLKITRSLNGEDLCGSILYVLDAPKPKRVRSAKRIGVDYAGHWKNRLLRFYDPLSSEVSVRETSLRRQ